MCEKGSSDQHMQMSEVSKKKGQMECAEWWRCLHFNCINLMGPRVWTNCACAKAEQMRVNKWATTRESAKMMQPS